MYAKVPLTLMITSRIEDTRRILVALNDNMKYLKVLEHTDGHLVNDDEVITVIRREREWCAHDQAQGMYVCAFPAEQILRQIEIAGRSVFSNTMHRLINEFDRVVMVGPNLELSVIKERPMADINEWRRFGSKVPDLKPDTSVADVQRVIDAYCAEINHPGRERDLFETVQLDPGKPGAPITLHVTVKPEHEVLAQRLRDIGFLSAQKDA